MSPQEPPPSGDTTVVSGRLAFGPGVVLNHLGLVVATGSVLLVATRLLAVSGYSPTTATAVLQAQGTAPVIVGSLIDFWPLIAVGTLGVILGARRHHVVRSLRGARALLTLAGLCWIVFLVPALFTAVLFLAYLTARLIGRLRHVGPASPGAARLAPAATAATAILLLGMGVAVNPTPWLPAERMEIDQQPPLVGYVLADTGTSLLVLVDDDRRVVRLPADEVPSRGLCRVRTALLVDRLRIDGGPWHRRTAS